MYDWAFTFLFFLRQSLIVKSCLAWNTQEFSCLHLLSQGIKGVQHFMFINEYFLSMLYKQKMLHLLQCLNVS